MEKFVMAAGAATRYADYGRGERTVLLLHGYLEAIEVWEEFGGQLGKSCRVIAPDLPGSGLSDYDGREAITVEYMAETAAEVLGKAGVPKCTVVGHSMGGYVALALAELHPELVEGLVLFHSTPNGDTSEKAAERQREIELIEGGRKELLSRVNPGRGFAPENRRRLAAVIEELGEQVMMLDDRAMIATLRGLALRPDRNAVMRAMPVPRMMLFGRHDDYIPADAAEAMAAGQPGARTEWLGHSGHMGFIEEPEASLALLTDFVGSLP